MWTCTRAAGAYMIIAMETQSSCQVAPGSSRNQSQVEAREHVYRHAPEAMSTRKDCPYMDRRTALVLNHIIRHVLSPVHTSVTVKWRVMVRAMNRNLRSCNDLEAHLRSSTDLVHTR